MGLHACMMEPAKPSGFPYSQYINHRCSSRPGSSFMPCTLHGLKIRLIIYTCDVCLLAVPAHHKGAGPSGSAAGSMHAAWAQNQAHHLHHLHMPCVSARSAGTPQGKPDPPALHQVACTLHGLKTRLIIYHVMCVCSQCRHTTREAGPSGSAPGGHGGSCNTEGGVWLLLSL